MRRILVPKYYEPLEHRPLIFLCGPLHGAPNWQEEAAKLILRKSKDMMVASPRRIFGDLLPPGYHRSLRHSFSRQRAWERYYLEKASRYGSILFWLPDADPARRVPNLTYGATTRFELGEWLTRVSFDEKIPLEIGGQEGFDTLHTVRYDMKRLAPYLKLHQSLEEVVDAAIERAERRFAESTHEIENVDDIVDLVQSV
jgi:hypothetical protein